MALHWQRESWGPGGWAFASHLSALHPPESKLGRGLCIQADGWLLSPEGPATSKSSKPSIQKFLHELKWRVGAQTQRLASGDFGGVAWGAPLQAPPWPRVPRPLLEGDTSQL